jgi:hypothetical protein
MTVAGSSTCVTELRLPNIFADTAEGQRPRRLAYQVVPPPHASAPSRTNAAQIRSLLGYRTPTPPTTSTNR